MLYDKDESIKGDMEVRALGISAMVVKEQLAGKRQAWLDSTANAIDMQIIGLDGRAAVQREQVKLLEINHDEVVPSKEEMIAKEKAAQMQQQQQKMLEAQQAAQSGAAPKPKSQAA